MTDKMKKVKVLTASLSAFVLGIGISQNACGLNCNQKDAARVLSAAFTSAYTNTTNIGVSVSGDRISDADQNIIRDIQNHNTHLTFIPDNIRPIGRMGGRHEFDRHFVHPGYETPLDINAPVTDFFILPGSTNNASAIINLLNGREANSFRLMVHSENGLSTIYADIDIARIGASLKVNGTFMPGQSGGFSRSFNPDGVDVIPFGKQGWGYLDGVNPLVKNPAGEHPTVNSLISQWGLGDEWYFRWTNVPHRTNSINYVPAGWPVSTRRGGTYKEVCLPFFVDHGHLTKEGVTQRANSNFTAITARFELMKYTPYGQAMQIIPTPSSFWPIWTDFGQAQLTEQNYPRL